jgi:hypothetical protein
MAPTVVKAAESEHQLSKLVKILASSHLSLGTLAWEMYKKL